MFVDILRMAGVKCETYNDTDEDRRVSIHFPYFNPKENPVKIRIFQKASLIAILIVAAFVLSACAPAQGVAQGVVELPTQLQAIIGVAVAYVIGLLLRGRIPEEFVMEIASAITTAVIAIVGVLLRLIPLNAEALATSILNVLVVLLGSFGVLRGVLVTFKARAFAQKIHLLP